MLLYNPTLGSTKDKSRFPAWVEVSEGAFKSLDALTMSDFNSLGWFEFITRQPAAGLIVDTWEIIQEGDTFVKQPVSTHEDPTLFERAVESKQNEIRDAAEAFLAPYKKEYCDTEIATWDQQYDEATKFLADPQVETPLLLAIATPRDTTVEELATRVVSNRAAWVAISGTIVGQRLTFQDQLDNASSLEDIYNITVNYSL